MDIIKEKQILREKMKKLRADCNDRPYRDRLILKNFFLLSAVKKSQSFFIYNSFGNEADTKNVIEELLKLGKTVYLPKVIEQEMKLIRYNGQAMEKGAFGILEPVGKHEDVIPDICVLPLLAVDFKFSRLGYGGGFYDKFLQDKDIYKIGLAYSFQLTDYVPVEQYDVVLDLIVTDREVLYRRLK